MVNLLISVPWQLCLFITMMLMIIKQWRSFSVMAVITIALSIGLYFRWYHHLGRQEPILIPE
jgi:hypothetical protein